MALGARSREEPPVAQWQLPIRGVIKNIRDEQVPADALYNAFNAELIDGKVQNRLGLMQHTSQLFGASPVAALNVWQNASADWIVLLTTNKIWKLNLATSTWTDVTGTTVPAGSLDTSGRVVQFEFGTPVTNYAYLINGQMTMQRLDPSTGVAADVVGSPALIRDLTVSGDRLVYLIGSHEIGWGEILTDATWPELNRRILAETAAPITAVRAIGTVGVAAYKRDSLWVGELTGLAGGSAFRFNYMDSIEGPAGPAALVDANGVHLYMTRTGRIGMFNGISHKWIGDGVWQIVKAEIDKTKPNRIWGVYNNYYHQVRFYYKRAASADTDGLVVVNLKRGSRDEAIMLPFSCWPGRSGKSLTAGCTVWDDNWETAAVFSNVSADERTYQIAGASDDGTTVSSFIQTGLIAPTKLEVARALSLEAMLERSGGYGTATAKMVSSNIIDNIDGVLSAGSTIDLTATPVKSITGFDARGRFLAVRYEWDSSATFRYRGSILRGMDAL